MKIKINILYWDSEDKQRLENTNLSWLYLKKFTAYCIENGLSIEPYLFDLSEEKILDEAIHIPFEKGSYKRSHKINKVIEYHGEGDYFFSVMDSDLIIRENDYQTFLYLLKKLKNDKFYVFHLDDLISLKGVDFINNKIEFDQLEYIQRIMEPDMGALFFIDIGILKYLNGFNQRFKVYGGEDNELSYRLQKKGFSKIILPIKPIHLPHINLYESIKDTIQYQEQLKILRDGGTF